MSKHLKDPKNTLDPRVILVGLDFLFRHMASWNQVAMDKKSKPD